MSLRLTIAATLAMGTLLLAQNPGNGNGKADGRGNRPMGIAAAGALAPAGPILLNYNGGPVMLGQTHIYYIWYGNWSADPKAAPILNAFANNITGSPHYNILTQYSQNPGGNISNSVVFSGSTNSTYVAAQPFALSDRDILNIVKAAISNNSLPLDANGVYFVLTAPGVDETSGFISSYCGWHTANLFSSTWVKYAFVGNAGNQTGCSAQPSGSPNNDPPVDAMVSVLAHELSEAVTDPLLNAWYDSNGDEIGDKCAWNFGGTFAAPNGTTANITLGGFDFLIQQEFSNASDSCVMAYNNSNFSLGVSPGSQSTLPGGTTGNYSVTVIPSGGFSSAVTLSVSGLPANAVLNGPSPNPASTTATFSISAKTAVPGTYPLTITGTSGTLTHTAAATLVILSPDYSLSVSPTKSALQGATTPPYTVTVNPVNGFSGLVNFGVTGLPAGASLSPAPAASSTSTTFAVAVGSSTAVGSYTLTITGTSGALTHSATATLVVSSSSSGNSAVFVKNDTTTSGNWKGVYGSNGYNVIDDTVSYPSYVSVTPINNVNYIWTNSTTDIRAPQKVSALDRIAATWYTSTTYTVDLNFTDGLQHQLAVYCLDWDNYGPRTQTVSVLDGSTNAVLDSRSLSTFQNGMYVVWNLSGHVILKIANTGNNAVISSLFFDPPGGGSQVAAPAFTPGAGTYSSTQSVTISSTTAGASFRYTTDGTNPSATIGTFYAGPVSVSSSETLKAIAYKSGMLDSTINSAAYIIGTSLGNSAVFIKNDTTTSGNWKGVYGSNGYNVIDDTVSYPSYVSVTPVNNVNYIWTNSTTDTRAPQKVLASDRIAATWYTSTTYTIDLNFTDGLQHQLAVYCLDWDSYGPRTQTLSVLDGSTNAVLDSRSLSSFQNGTYVVWNLSGHVILRIANTGNNAVISSLFFDPPGGGSQVAAPAFTPGAGTYSSSQSVTISSTTAGASFRYTTDGTNPSATIGTLYAGPVSVSSSETLKAIAYKSGMLDSTINSAAYIIGTSLGNSAVFVKNDTTTSGNWKGVYGSNGYNVIDDTVSYPSYVSVTPINNVNYIWTNSTTDIRAPQKVSASDRIAATWYTSTTYTVDLNFTDGLQHQLAVYCLDWDSYGPRTQTVSVLDGSTNAVLDSRSLSSFQNGVYVVWNLSGHVILKVANTGSNAVISGLFF